MNPIILSHVKSFIITFLATFLIAFGTALTGLGHVEITSTLIVSLLIGAAQTAIKEVFERNAPQAIGGRK